MAEAGAVPRRLRPPNSRPDRAFRAVTGGAALASVGVVAAAISYLIRYSLPVFRAHGVWRFLSTSVWAPAAAGGHFGVGGLLMGTLLIAGVALVIAVPLSLSSAIFTNEYAPERLRRVIVPLMDLLAAVPALVFGMWGFYALRSHLVGPATWLAANLSVIPLFRTSPSVRLGESAFVAGVLVAVTITPVIAAVSRDVLAQVPRDQCEGALALGGSRWTMVRDVILPFGRSGIVGACLLGFGRAIGETIAVILVVELTVGVQPHILESGAASVGAYIVTHFGEGGLSQSALVAAGLTLFVLTLAVSLTGRAIVAGTRRRAAS